jgi:hypothetical protein
MSVESLFSSPFIDFLRRRAELLRKRQGRTARPRAGGGPPGTTLAEGRRHAALADGLVFRVVARPDRPRRDVRLVEELFRTAFARAWDGIPEQERRTLLRYWHDQPDTGRPVGAGPRPEIRVLARASCAPPPPACDRLGHRLTFAVVPSDEPAGRLPQVIARTLALALRYATGRHWGLILERIEDPMERWERRAGKHADDAARAAKLDRLEADYLAAYEAEIAGILRGWGFDPRALGADQPGRENDGV